MMSEEYQVAHLSEEVGNVIPAPKRPGITPAPKRLATLRLYYENRRQAASRVTLWPRRWSWRTERRVMAARSRSSK